VCVLLLDTLPSACTDVPLVVDVTLLCCGDDSRQHKEERVLVSSSLVDLVAISKDMRVVRLCSAKILTY